ncbi:MAG: bifunctional folylpolyglutamate synthase/dihydrofolate synthase [Pyrinomonadaceae bacterium]|nr:bifunctional folylpolyglutamate synthase/dihydrofolate synthase [Sphingobacteriaceae bacterium]
MNYPQTLSYLYSRLPMFTRVGSSAYKANLDNILAFCKHLDDPQDRFKSIHVGGTNGKGSTSHMLAAILQTAGYKTGLYTSPHLRDFRERIRINGEMISEDEVVKFVEKNKELIEQIEPSFFEATVAMAFDYFAKQEIDIAVIEVGLGGRLDSTNIINPLLSVITNIGYDHMAILGDKLELIAYEKAGIIKPGIPVVIGEKQDEVAEIFSRKAKECGAELVFASEEFKIQKAKVKSQKLADESKGMADNSTSDFLSLSVMPSTSANRQIDKSTNPQIFKSSNYLLDLTGIYQIKNLATVLSSVDQLRKQGLIITEEQIKSALKQVKSLTGLMGRWQTLSTNPLVICDTGHNEDGIREVVKNIGAVPFEKLHMVIGMVKDKDISSVLKLLPKKAIYYFCQPDIPRAKAAEELAAEAKVYHLEGKAYSSIPEALNAAKSNASPKDLIFVGGSTFVVAEVV